HLVRNLASYFEQCILFRSDGYPLDPPIFSSGLVNVQQTPHGLWNILLRHLPVRQHHSNGPYHNSSLNLPQTDTHHSPSRTCQALHWSGHSRYRERDAVLGLRNTVFGLVRSKRSGESSIPWGCERRTGVPLFLVVSVRELTGMK